MARILRFVAALVIGLALVTWAASVMVRRTTRSWFETDLRLRAQSALGGARATLASDWDPKKPAKLHTVLAGIESDARMMAVAACSPASALVTATVSFPGELNCDSLGAHLAHENGLVAAEAPPWYGRFAIRGGSAHVSLLPVRDNGKLLGFVVLVQDLSVELAREEKSQHFLLYAGVFLAVAASLVSFVAAWWSRRDWNEGLRRLLHGEIARPEFKPFLRDVRQFVDGILASDETKRSGTEAGASGDWTPQRLKADLNRYLHGERVVIVANREPYIHTRANGEGEGIEVLHPASGLVTALEPVMRACSGVWIAHGSGNADRETVDAHDHVLVPPGEEQYVLRRVWLTSQEEQGYYFGLANEGLWPLCHLADVRPVFRSEDWKQYRAVNERFVEAVLSEVDADDPIVLVQDYHFALVPQLLRERLPRATILMFWHIPWPNAERFGICPWRNEIIEGMLGSSILGFHTQVHCNNFIDSVDRYLEARIDRDTSAVVRHGGTTLIRPYPISLEWPSRWLQGLPSVEECRRSLRAAFGLAPDALVGVGVARLDYTKGVGERLLAVERMLDRFPRFRGRFTFVQLAAPSRTKIERYRTLNEEVEALAARINEKYGSGEYRPILLRRFHHEPPAVFRYYRAADLCYVSSLHDGMNLVAKEFVASRDDEQGVLVLSKFTGAARELTEALIVNPYDLDEASGALAEAVLMTPAEQRERMRAMRRSISEANVYRWAGRMIADAARVRSSERLSDRISQRTVPIVADAHPE